MGNFVTLSEIFEKKAKKLLKKFPTFGETLKQLERDLILNPFSGTKIGHHVFKVRFLDASKGKGKRGGFRAITYLVKQKEEGFEIILLTLYDKSEQDNMSKIEIQEIVEQVITERKRRDQH